MNTIKFKKGDRIIEPDHPNGEFEVLGIDNNRYKLKQLKSEIEGWYEIDEIDPVAVHSWLYNKKMAFKEELNKMLGDENE